MNDRIHRWPPQPAPGTRDLARMLAAVRREVGWQYDNRQVGRG